MYWHNPDVVLPELPVPEGLTRDEFETALDGARTYCGWHLAPVVTHELTLDGGGSRVLVLPSLAVQSVSDVSDKGAEVDPDSFGLSVASQCLVRGRRSWSDAPSGVRLTITHGYATLPPTVLKAIASMAQSEATGGTGYVAAGTFTYSGQPVSKESTTGLTSYEEGALRPFKLGPRP